MTEASTLLIITKNPGNTVKYSKSKDSIIYIHSLNQLDARYLRGIAYSHVILIGLTINDIPSKEYEAIKVSMISKNASILEL